MFITTPQMEEIDPECRIKINHLEVFYKSIINFQYCKSFLERFFCSVRSPRFSLVVWKVKSRRNQDEIFSRIQEDVVSDLTFVGNKIPTWQEEENGILVFQIILKFNFQVC